MQTSGENIDLVLIGYSSSNRPKIVLDTSFQSRVLLWREGCSVDAIPRQIALEIESARNQSAPKV